MSAQKWFRVEGIRSARENDYVLCSEYHHPEIRVYVEFIEYRGRQGQKTPRYRVVIEGNGQRIALAYRSGKQRLYTLGTAKRKAEFVAQYENWLLEHGLIKLC